MITEYFRPQTLDEALALIERESLTLPLGGGTLLNGPHPKTFAVADLQALGFENISMRGKFLEAGASVTLQALAESPDLQESVRKVVLQEATFNLRNQATIAGTLIAADGRSPLGCALLAMDAAVKLLPVDQSTSYGQLIHMRAGVSEGLPHLKKQLITQVTINTEVVFAFEYIARSPADRPVVTAAAAAWSSGRMRVVVGGWGAHPRLAFDAPESGGIETAVRSAAAEAGDQWATAEYRQETAVILAKRVVEQVI